MEIEDGNEEELALNNDAELQSAIASAESHVKRSVGRILLKRLGPMHTMRTLAHFALMTLQGHPFKELGEPVDDRDRLSRKQLGPAVLIYRALQHVGLPTSQATELVKDLVTVGGLRFLDHLLAPIANTPSHQILRHRDRIKLVLARFMNAEAKTKLTEDGTLHYTVYRCRFVELLNRVGTPELAPLFCDVDREYFQTDRTTIVLARRRTLAAGDNCCDFRFSLGSHSKNVD